MNQAQSILKSRRSTSEQLQEAEARAISGRFEWSGGYSTFRFKDGSALRFGHYGGAAVEV